MTVMTGVVSAMADPSEEVLLALSTVALTVVLGYIFYPAISLAWADSIAIEEVVVSTAVKSNGKVVLPFHAFAGLARSLFSSRIINSSVDCYTCVQ
jgi:hypothetical protein